MAVMVTATVTTTATTSITTSPSFLAKPPPDLQTHQALVQPTVLMVPPPPPPPSGLLRGELKGNGEHVSA